MCACVKSTALALPRRRNIAIGIQMKVIFLLPIVGLYTRVCWVEFTSPRRFVSVSRGNRRGGTISKWHTEIELNFIHLPPTGYVHNVVPFVPYLFYYFVHFAIIRAPYEQVVSVPKPAFAAASVSAVSRGKPTFGRTRKTLIDFERAVVAVGVGFGRARRPGDCVVKQ